MEQATQYPFIVVDVSNNESKGLGTYNFRVPPHRGDYITIAGEDGTAYAYEVITVIHPSKPTSTCGDLIVRRSGTDIELRMSLGRFPPTGMQKR